MDSHPQPRDSRKQKNADGCPQGVNPLFLAAEESSRKGERSARDHECRPRKLEQCSGETESRFPDSEQRPRKAETRPRQPEGVPQETETLPRKPKWSLLDTETPFRRAEREFLEAETLIIRDLTLNRQHCDIKADSLRPDAVASSEVVRLESVTCTTEPLPATSADEFRRSLPLPQDGLPTPVGCAVPSRNLFAPA